MTSCGCTDPDSRDDKHRASMSGWFRCGMITEMRMTDVEPHALQGAAPHGQASGKTCLNPE
jgi:hypothetical protein